MGLKISVIVPTFKRPQLLNRCIGALSRQSLRKADYELIIVSDGPDVETEMAVKKWIRKRGLNIKHGCLPFKKGPAAARNLGWLQAKGDLVAFTDDDCIPYQDWLKTLWDEYNSSKAEAFTGKVIVPLPDRPTDYERNTANLETAEFITANCACTKRALIETGGFDERFELAWREDSDLHFKLLLHNIRIKRTPATVVHPVREAPFGVSLKEQKKGMFNALLYKKYPGLYEKKIGSKAPWNYYASIISFAGILCGWVSGSGLATSISLSCWLLLLIYFVIKRLSATSHSFRHIAEMVLTSMAIPFLSVYWQLYGAWKYRVLFI